MPFAEFDALPPDWRWKREYLDGVAYIRPREVSIAVRLNLNDVPDPGPPSPRWRVDAAVPKRDRAALIRAYIASFRNTPDRCDYIGASLRKAAQQWAQEHLPKATISVLLCPRTRPDAAFGLLLVKPTEAGPLMDILMVRPGWQGQGAATYMLRVAARELRQQGETELYSLYHPLNTASEAWHIGQGFREVPSLQITALRLRTAREQRRRTAEDGGVPITLTERIVALEALHSELEAKRKADGYEAIELIFWLR